MSLSTYTYGYGKMQTKECKPFLTVRVNANGPSPHNVCNEAVSELVICLSKFNELGYPPSTVH